MAAPSDVDLGFVESTDYWRLLSHFFPSKVGGKPAWLGLKHIPNYDSLKCGKCGKVCVFLMQTYAPVEEVATCFHRTVFIFVCRDPACCASNDSSSFVVVRCQLPKDNEFYSPEPPDDSVFDESEPHPSADKLQDVCAVCGIAGPKRCAKCHTAAYCSKQHQTLDWKAGHKHVCCQQDGDKYSVPLLFPEYELVMEPEAHQPIPTDEKTEEEKLKEYKDFVQETDGGPGKKLSEKDLNAMAKAETKKDKQFHRFKKRVAHEPEQVIRYDRGGTPLWVSGEAIPTEKDIPHCSCGAARQFEFQVMPQLLSHLKVDSVSTSIDWGTLAVYTCTQHCSVAEYCKEFLWKQDFSADDV